MAITVGIFGMSGDGKTTSTIINPDGTYDFSKEGYKGMDPQTHFIINLDMKDLPFPPNMWDAARKNYVETDNFDVIIKALTYCAKDPKIKSVSLDTLNLYLAYKEFNDRKKFTYDEWRGVANDIIELLKTCNTLLRKDQIVYIMGHLKLMTDIDGREKKVLSLIGKKSDKNQPEGLFPICLFTKVEYDGNGKNKHMFETQANRSTGKTPIGMFDNFEIPNSLKLVDSTIRQFKKIE